jgi:hypothetical protein
VGQSLDPKNRFTQHISEGINKSNKKADWIKSLIQKGKLPISKLLTTSSLESAHKKEDLYIEEYNNLYPGLILNSPGPANKPCFNRKAPSHEVEKMRKAAIAKYPDRPYVGVYATEAGTFRARIKHNRKIITLGTYNTAEEAAKSRDSAVLYYYPDCTLFNFPNNVIAKSIQQLRQENYKLRNKSSKYKNVSKRKDSDYWILKYTVNKKTYQVALFPSQESAAKAHDMLELYYNAASPKLNFPKLSTEAKSIDEVRKISRLERGMSSVKLSKYRNITYRKNMNDYEFQFKVDGIIHRRGGYSTEIEAARGFNNYITTNYINKPLIVI